MVCCASDAPLDELLRLILDSGHSRVPIYEGSVDRIVGVIYAKDLLRYWGARADELSPATVMRTPYFVPETKRIEDLLVDFRTRRVHMAIVVDEYGGTSGLITIEDLLEEIVGDIQDEYDLEEEWVQPQSDGSLLLDARANVEELEKFFDLEISRDKFDTVGGFLIHLLGNVPVAGETARANGLLLQVVEADERKVRRVQVWRDPEAAVPETGA
jgi:magnesium and cobalt transporter